MATLEGAGNAARFKHMWYMMMVVVCDLVARFLIEPGPQTCD